jgi:signal transduction histidine kinase/CheY-like chemotaxis protein
MSATAAKHPELQASAPGRGPTMACVVSPDAADAELAILLLRQDGIPARAFANLRDAATALNDPIGCLIVVEEALVQEDVLVLRDALQRLPAWNDVPLIIIAGDIGEIRAPVAAAFPNSGNVTLLERPVNPHTLASSATFALRASQRQREVGELLAEREHAVRLRDEFLAMLAHELRNPLAPLRNAVYLMRSTPSDPRVMRQTVDILDRQVGHVVRMVDDLLDVARLERGKLTLKKQRLDLNRLVAAAVESCLQGVQYSAHHIRVHLVSDPLPIDGDPVRIEQILVNLIGNAAKFSPSGSEIGVETTCVDGRRASVAVVDHGAGFPPEAAAELFAPFRQMNATLERSTGGLGLGLSIVQRLTQLHGGVVRASSPGLGCGARFEVSLPLASDPPPQVNGYASETVATQAPSGRIVVVEDNADILATLKMMISIWGHVVDTATDGRSGVDLILEKSPDVALVDLGLPGLNGFEVARRVREALPRESVRLIAVTGYGQPSDTEMAMEAGFDLHLLKPVSPEILQRMIADSLAQPRSRSV